MAIVGKCDVEDDEDLAARFGVRNIPTVVFIKDGKEVDRSVGLVPRPVLEDKIKALL
jgi:thioredoxin 1